MKSSKPSCKAKNAKKLEKSDGLKAILKLCGIEMIEGSFGRLSAVAQKQTFFNYLQEIASDADIALMRTDPRESIEKYAACSADGCAFFTDDLEELHDFLLEELKYVGLRRRFPD